MKNEQKENMMKQMKNIKNNNTNMKGKKESLRKNK